MLGIGPSIQGAPRGVQPVAGTVHSSDSCLLPPAWHSATLAAAFVVLGPLAGTAAASEASGSSGGLPPSVTFETSLGAGDLTVTLAATATAGTLASTAATASAPLRLTMDFPSRPPLPVSLADPSVARLLAALHLPAAAAVSFVGRARDWIVHVDSAAAVAGAAPDMAALIAAGDGALCVVVCAVGAAAAPADVVSRVFCPACAVPEDPVTGSAHCTIAPYVAGVLGGGRTRVAARQASARGGDIECELSADGTRVALTGCAVLYLRGEIEGDAAAALREV